MNGYEVLERFDKKEKFYYFEFRKDNFTYVNGISHEKILTKKVVTNISDESLDNATFVTIESKVGLGNMYKLDNAQVGIHLLNNELLAKMNITFSEPEKTGNFKNTTYYNLLDRKYYIWNYQGLDIISKSSQSDLKVLNKDIYDLKLVYQIEDLIMLADYNQDYIFKKFYLVNMKTGKLSTWDLPEEFYLDSYFMGDHKSSIYMVDRKNKRQIQFQPFKKKFRYVAKNNQKAELYKDGFESISLNKIVSENVYFETTETIHFKLENNTLHQQYKYSDYKVRVSEQSIKEIVYVTGDTVYYLVDDKLYAYQNEIGEVLVMQNFEWKFNYKNMIFIY